MRMPRFRIRTLMVAVAVTALTVWGGIGVIRLHRLSRYYRAKATQTATHEAALRTLFVRAEADFRSALKNGHLPKWVDDDWIISMRRDGARTIEYHALLKQKYDRAARYPWLPVEPDPPQPK